MQLPYIDDRRMALYGKVMALYMKKLHYFLLKPLKQVNKIPFSTFLFISAGIWWLFNSQDVSCNR